MNEYELSSRTKVSERKLNEKVTETVYEEKGKRITVNSWWITSGEDDVDQEFEIVKEEDI